MDGPRTQSGILGLCEGWIRLSEEELRRCTNLRHGGHRR